jgi:hypothetical protein
MNNFDHTARYPNITAHRLIAEVATAMAQEVYEELCSGSNALYKVHGDRDDAVRQWAPMLVKAAKVQLGQMLNNPTVSDYEKEQIYEALVLDATLPKGGLSVTPKPH